MSDQGRDIWVVFDHRGEPCAYLVAHQAQEDWEREPARYVPAAELDRLVEAIREKPCECPHTITALTEYKRCWGCQALREAGVEEKT